MPTPATNAVPGWPIASRPKRPARRMAVQPVERCCRPPGSELALKALMIAGLDGDALAHDALLRAIAPLLRGFYGRRLPSAYHDVEDLVQDTLISVHTRCCTYDRDRPFTAWMYAIARHRLVDHFRRSKNVVSFEALDVILESERFEDASIARLDVGCLLGCLSAKQARAIRDIHIEGLSAAEAARRADIGESDVKVSAHRGIKMLTTRFGIGRLSR